MAPDDDVPEDLNDGRDIYGEDDPLPDDLDSEAGEGSRGGDSPESTRAGPPRKIVVLAGPDKGKIQRFTGVRMVVGRTASCNIHLSDSSVSRRHLELVQGSNGVMLRDLGSGNGTKVNGERVTERILKHMDVVEIGQTRFQFVDEIEAVRLAREEAERQEEEEKRRAEEEKRKAEEEAAAKAAAEEAAKDGAEQGAQEGEAGEASGRARKGLKGLDLRQKLAIGLAAGAVLFVGFMLVAALVRSPAPPPPDPREALAAKKMDLARVAIAEERFEDAIALIESAEKLHPGIDADGFGTRARTELAAQKGLDAARALLDQQRFEDARAELARIPPEASSKRLEAKKMLEEELDLKQGEYLENAAREAIAALDVAAARQLIQQLPPDKQGPLLAQLVEAEKAAEQQAKVRAAQEKAELERQRHAAQAAHQAQVDAQFRAVERKFNMEDFDRAALECDRLIEETGDAAIRQRALALKRLIPQFARSWQDGEKKYRAQALESAVRPLLKARALYRQIRLPGGLAATLEDHLLEALNVAGRAALLRNDLASAYLYYREAQGISPGDGTSKQGLERIAEKAEDLYREGYMIRLQDPKGAIEKYKLVLEVAPKGSSAYNKAKAQIAAMQP